MFCHALQTGGEVDNESFGWADSILTLSYLAVPLLSHFCIAFVITYLKLIITKIINS